MLTVESSAFGCCCRWHDGDASSYWSVISYPDKLREYVIQEFARIKHKQAKLLGFKPRFTTKASQQMSKL